MNILLTVTIAFLSGESAVEEIGLFKAEADCVLIGQMVSGFIIDGNSVNGVSYTCTKQEKA